MGFLTRRAPSLVQATFDRDYCRDVNAPLLHVGRDAWTLGQSFEGTLVLGATGSGKSSGSGAAIARSFLRSGYGGLVLCAKPNERETWERYAKECGREDSVIVFDGSGRERFNFLDYELRRGGAGSGNTFNIVQLFMHIMGVGSRRKGVEGGGDAFWEDSARELLSHVVDALIAAYGTLRLSDIVQFIDSMPLGEDRRKSGFCFQTLHKMHETPILPLTPHDKQAVEAYVFARFSTLADKTRTGIIAHFNSLAHPFAKGAMHELFCTHTTVVPELTHEGALLIVDLPLKVWESTGLVAQAMLKYIWQKSTERRDVKRNPRPVFLFADEAQFFLSEYDNEFQSTARSARAATVYLTQNLSGVYANIGGKQPEHTAHALLGNLRTKIFHSNDDHTTNQWAANLLGKTLQERRNWNQGESYSTSTGQSYGESSNWGGGGSSNPQGGYTSSSNWGRGRNYGTNSSRSQGSSHSAGASEQMDYRVQPNFFAERLRGGSKANNCMVDGLIFQPSRKFANGENFTVCAFQQS